MGNDKLGFISKFEQSERIINLEKRNQTLAISGKRKLYGGYEGDKETFVFGWSGAEYTPSPGEEVIINGDHACWIDIGEFPELEHLPSKKNGYEMSCLSWGTDYAFMLDNTPANIHSYERIVGEIYWEMHMLRRYDWHDTGTEVFEQGKVARELGCGGLSSGHTCPDLAIGLSQGYGRILEQVRQSIELYERLENPRKVNFLRGLEAICLSCMRYIQRYAELAEKQMAETEDLDEKARYRMIADCCNHIATEPPRNYYEAVQWIQFAILFDRSVGHGNGYGRLDLYLIAFYKRGIADGTLTRTDAREFISEMYMKLRGHFFCVGGRDAELKDATNEMSWVVLEAYDLIGDYNNLGVMWHPDMDPDFYAYTCDVLARHGESIPVLANYDLMYESELRSGIPHEQAWTVAYCGCQWFCIPGREYCDHDVNSFIAILPMNRAITRAVKDGVQDFETLYRYFQQETAETAKAFRNMKRSHDAFLGEIWPEMFTSLLSHGPIERGIDIVAPRGVDYQFTSVNILGIPNTSDSLHAIKKLVFEKKMYSLEQVKEAIGTNWENNEPMRLRFLGEDKYGNDIDEVDSLYVRVCNTICNELEGLYNQKGQPFRPSLFHFQGHIFPTVVGATPDGRLATDYLAHGVNPTAGMNEKGLIPTANSLSKVKANKFQGAPLQIDLQPKFFDGKEEIWKYVRDFSTAYFKNGGIQINLHIMDLKKLEDAIQHPENPEYQNIIVRVTGYAARFISLSRSYQEEFVARMNYDSM